ncbi:MAG TPA: PAS domain S-box protein [Labilithrix sp.]|nr:PAS domain S-box protein [Labilithrix sp.]
MVAAVPEILRAIVDALPDGVILHDPRRGIVYVNPAFRTFIGSDEDFVGRPVLDLIHPADQALARERIRFAIDTGKATESRVLRFVARGGSPVEGECRGVSYRAGDDELLIVVVRDLTERQRARQALERSDALFRTLIEDLPTGVLVQGPSAEILVSNRAALDLLGLDEAQLLGRTSFDPEWKVTHEDGTPFDGAEHPVPTAIRTRRPVRDVVMGVYRPPRKDRVWLLVNAEPQLDAQGQVVQVVCTFSDFTERRRLQAQAAAGDRLASMGRLAAGVAHEINNPLAYVIGHLEALRSAPLDDALRLRAEEALEGAGRVRAIVDDLRALSRGDDERRGPVDLVRVIQSACSIASAHVRHRARLVRDLAPVAKVEANESRLGQLVLNLIVNAAEAIPEGRVAKNEIRVRLRPGAPGRVILEVIDTGAGIPASAIDHIFDPFFTTKPIGIGTGLGLSICHGIVTSFGGKIDVVSTVGQGSTFRVDLPASTSHASSPAPEATPVPPPSRARILIIDDDPRVGKALAELLRLRHDVQLEVRAAAALERLLAGEHYDVVFCDLMMPEMTGMDFQEALEERAPEVARRTLFMTGGAFTPRAHAFLDRLPGRSLQKPFRMADLERAIAAIMGGASADGGVTASRS